MQFQLNSLLLVSRLPIPEPSALQMKEIAVKIKNIVSLREEQQISQIKALQD